MSNPCRTAGSSEGREEKEVGWGIMMRVMVMTVLFSWPLLATHATQSANK